MSQKCYFWQEKENGNRSTPGVVESGTAELTIDSVTGYKKVNGILESKDSNATTEKNEDQGSADTSFDVPSGGVGYYLVPAATVDATRVYKYSNANAQKFIEYSEGTMAYTYVDLSGAAGATYYQVRQYTFGQKSGQTVTINAPYDFSASGAINGAGLAYVSSETAVTLAAGSKYKIWLNHDSSNVSLGTEIVSSIPVSHKESIEEPEQKPAMAQRAEETKVEVKGRSFTKGDPKKADDSTSRVVYYALSETDRNGYTVKVNINIGDNNTWRQYTMESTGKTTTVGGTKKTVWTATVVEKYGGVDALQFQLYQGSTWKSQVQPISSWTTSDSWAGKMYDDSSSSWVTPTYDAATTAYFYLDASSWNLSVGTKPKMYYWWSVGGNNTTSDGSISNITAIKSGGTYTNTKYWKFTASYWGTLSGIIFFEGGSVASPISGHKTGDIKSDLVSGNIFNTSGDLCGEGCDGKIYKITRYEKLPGASATVIDTDYILGKMSYNTHDISGGIPAKNGFTSPTTWNTNSDGSGITYNPSDGNASWINNVSADQTLYAIYTGISYSITYDTNGGDSINAGSYTSSGAAQTPTLSTPSRTGYDFTGYEIKTQPTSGGASISNNTTLNLPTGTYGNLEVRATWNIHPYTITYSGGGTASNPDTYYINSSDITLNNPAKDGYTFTGWSGTGLVGSNNMSVTIAAGSTGDRSYTAHWQANQYSISYRDQGNVAFSGMHATGYPTTHTYGTATTLKTASKTGYIFGGWYSSSACTGDAVTTLGATAYTAAITLYAKWTAKTSTLSFDLNTTGSVSDVTTGSTTASPTYATYDSTLPTLSDIPTRTYNGRWVFLGYFDSEEKQYYDSSLRPVVNRWDKDTTSTTTLFAHWSQDKFTLAYNGGGSTSGSKDPVDNNVVGAPTSIVANPFTKTGHHFLGWIAYNHYGTESKTVVKDVFNASGAEVNVTFDPNKIADGDTVTLVAQWEADTYTITYKDQGDADFSGSHSSTPPTSHTYGVNTPLNSATKTGYTFGGWFTNSSCTGVSVGSLGATEFTANITLYAKWTPITYTIIYKDQGNVDFSGSHADGHPTSHTYGTATTLKTASKTGYTFNGWYTNSTCTEGPVSSLGATAYTANITLYAKWTPITYTITYLDQGGVAFSGAHATGYPTNHTYATATTLKTASKEGYTFDGWYTNSACTEGPVSSLGATAYTANITLYAKWTANYYTITLNNQSATTAGTTSIYERFDDGYYRDYSNGTYSNKMATNANRITIPTKTGYTFGGYYLYNGTWNASDQYIDADGYLTSNAAADHFSADGTLYAKWTPKTYTVTLDRQSGTGGSGSVTATYNSAMPAMTKPTRSGYEFQGYYTEQNGGGTQYYNASGSSAHIWDIDGATILYAYWTTVTYTLTYINLNGASHSNPGSYTIETATIVLADPGTRNGYTFVEWRLTDSSGSKVTQIALGSTGNKTLFAYWEANTYNISYIRNGGTINAGQVDTYTTGTGATLPTNVTRTDYTFRGWYTNSSFTGDAVTSIGTTEHGDKTFYAKWSRNKTSGTYYLVGNSTFNTSTGIGGSSASTWDTWAWNDEQQLMDGTTNNGDLAAKWGVYLSAGAEVQAIYYDGSSETFKKANSDTGCSEAHAVWDGYDGHKIVVQSGQSGYYNFFVNSSGVLCCQKSNIHTITLDGNDGTPSSTTVDHIQYRATDLSSYTATRANYIFGGWAETGAATVSTTVVTEVPANLGEDKTYYAIWLSESDLFKSGETYYLIINSKWKEGSAVFYLNVCNGPSSSQWVRLTNITSTDLYYATLPYGENDSTQYWRTLIYTRQNPSGSPEWDYPSVLWNQTHDFSKANFATNNCAEITTSSNEGQYIELNTGYYLRHFTEYTEGETIYLKPNSGWKADSAGFALYVFGGTNANSTQKWFPMTKYADSIGEGNEYWYVELTGNDGSDANEKWIGGIFVRYNTGAGAPSWSNYLDQTADLYRYEADQICYVVNSYVDHVTTGSWTKLTNRASGYYYLVGSSTALGAWDLEDTTHVIAGTTGDTYNACWTSISLSANDQFKIVYVDGKIPIWHGYEGTCVNITGFAEALSGNGSNIKVLRDCVVTIFYTKDPKPWISVSSYTDTVEGKGYSGISDSADASGNVPSFAVTVTVDLSDTSIESVTPASGASAATYFTFSHYAVSNAKNGTGALDYVIASGAPTLYAIYTRDVVTVEVKAIYDAETTFVVRTHDYDKGTRLDTHTFFTDGDLVNYDLHYGSNAEGALYAFKAASKTLYSDDDLTIAVAGSTLVTADIVYYVSTVRKKAVTFYLDTTGLSAWETSSWQIHFYPMTTMYEYFHIDANSTFKIVNNLYKVTMPESWQFYLGNGTGSLDHYGFNWVDFLDTADTNWTEMVLTYSQGDQGIRHGRAFLLTKDNPSGTATIYINGVAAGTMAHGDGTTNYFVYEGGIEVNKGYKIHVRVTGTGNEALDGTYDFANYGAKTTVQGKSVPDAWYLEADAVTTNTVTVLIADALSWSNVYCYAWKQGVADSENAAFPGQLMSANGDIPKEGYHSYYIDLDSDNYDHIIFSKGDAGGQTAGDALDLSKVNTYEVASNRSVTVTSLTPSGTNSLYSTANARFNFYIYQYESSIKWSIAAVPSLGNGYYIMETSKNGNSTKGYNGAVKMITDSDGLGASYSHYKVTGETTIYLSSYLSGQDHPIYVTNNSCQAVGATKVDDRRITLAAGYYSIVVSGGVVVISGYEASSFFTLNGYDLTTRPSIFNAQTALVLEIEVSLENNAPMTINATVNNALGNFVGYYMEVRTSKIESGVYDAIRGKSAETYRSKFTYGPTITNNTQIQSLAIRHGNPKAYVYILVDYIDVDVANFDLTKYNSAIAFTLRATQVG